MRSAALLSLLLATFLLPACGLGPVTSRAGLAPHVRTAAGSRARADEQARESAMLTAIGEDAKQAIKDIDAKYAELGLNTASGRKITPAREPALKQGLAPFLAALEQRLAGYLDRLRTDDRYADLVRDLSKRHPLADEAIAPDANASAMLYRGVQQRLKLGVLIEYAVRQGAVAD